MKLWSAFRLSTLAVPALVTIALLGCGDIDPSEPAQRGGSGGDSSSAGDGTGATAMAGSGEGGAGAVAPVGGAGGEPSVGPLEPLLPWAVGNTWTYQVTQAGVVSQKITTVEAEEMVGGDGPFAETLAFHVITQKGTNGNDKTESWQGPDEAEPLRIVRYREQSFSASTGDLQMDEYWEPPKIHIDGSAARTVAGATWLEDYDETKLEVGLPPTTHAVRDRWTVLADDLTLEVPAGTFENVIHLRKAGSGSTKEYWYVRGVGKLKETGTQTEELVDYHIEALAP